MTNAMLAETTNEVEYRVSDSTYVSTAIYFNQAYSFMLSVVYLFILWNLGVDLPGGKQHGMLI